MAKKTAKRRPSKPPVLHCSFCDKSQYEVRKLIAGPTTFICDACVELCMGILREERGKELAARELALWDDQIAHDMGLH